MTRATVFSWFRLPVLKESVQSYGQTKRDFYESRIYLQNLDRLSSTFTPNHLAGLTTEKSIAFYGIQFGQSLKATINKLGKPNFRTSDKRLFNDHKIIFYRLKVSAVNCIIQFHFIHDAFFLGVIEMRTGDERLKDRLFDLIKEKYQIDGDITRFPIRDGGNNQIRVREDVVPYVIYTTGDPVVRKELTDLSRRPVEENFRVKMRHRTLLLDMI